MSLLNEIEKHPESGRRLSIACETTPFLVNEFPNISRIILHGSTVRAQAQEHSDIDLAVFTLDETDSLDLLLKRSLQMQQLLAENGFIGGPNKPFGVHILCWPDSRYALAQQYSLESEKYRNGILGQAVTHGLTLYQRIPV